MKKIIFLIINLSMFFILLATKAQAEDGIYLTAEGGWGNQTGLPSKTESGANRISTTYFPSAIRFGVGYNHDLDRFFGIGMNIGVGKYGEDTYYFSNNKSEINSEAIEFLAVGTFHIHKVDLFGKVGGIRQMMLITGGVGQDHQTQIHPEAAIGAAYNFTQHFAGTFTYAHVFSQKIESLSKVGEDSPSLDEALLGVRVTF